MSTAALESLAAPLDVARRNVMRISLKSEALRFVIVDRERRIAAQALVGICFAFFFASVAPALMLAITPVLFGVPHVASDVRYLIVRQKMPRSWLYVVLGACASMLLMRGLETSRIFPSFPFDRVELGFGAAWIALAALFGARGSWRRAALVLAPLAALVAAAMHAPNGARLVLAHAHNGIAVIVWAMVFRRSRRSDDTRARTRSSGRATLTLPLAFLVLALGLILSGVTIPLAAHIGGLAALGLRMDETARWLAPGLPAGVALAVTISYAFLQSVHYGTWLGWIPQEQTRSEGTLSFAMTFRALTKDLGATGTWCVVGLTVLVIGAAVFDLSGTRNLYLSLAVFHGYLELAMLVFLSLAGAPSGARMTPVAHWALVFALTTAIEAPIVFFMFRGTTGRAARLLPIALFAQLATHPIVWFVMPALGLPEVPTIALCEVWAIGIETWVYAVCVPAPWARALAVSAFANAASYGIGLALRALGVGI